jgi:hypothetical protein
MAPELCDQNIRPKRREHCFERNCLPSDCEAIKAQNTGTNSMDGNYTVLVAGFRVQVYCHRMNETLPKTYVNVLATTNFAEFYGKRLVFFGIYFQTKFNFWEKILLIKCNYFM